ncbi:hypothetical protein L9F63_004963 [Diploptera punctata]|uniref:Ionotropic glutamate receptor C-terminal domain-containing protein n=1 Tax=Diploptera punctata TaxID=6984 RepID=A0AAD7ZF75_DIPPU|nr:hypothetical protein L9F63_004963 [Diploptera punctata]
MGVSVSHMPRTHSLRILFIFWVAYCLAVTTVFQAFFFTFLIKPGLEHQINSFEEMLTSRVNFGYSPLMDAIVSDSEPLVREERVVCNHNNTPPCLDWVAYHDNFSILLSTIYMEYTLTSLYLDENGKPLICQAGDTFYSTNYVTYMNKGNPLLEQFNRILQNIVEAGFNTLLTKRHMELQKIQAAVQGRKITGEEYYSLSLDHLQGAFLIHLCGIILSLLVFVLENICRKFTLFQKIHGLRHFCYNFSH